jgi:hypothetical protein
MFPGEPIRQRSSNWEGYTSKIERTCVAQQQLRTFKEAAVGCCCSAGGGPRLSQV